MGKTLGSKRKGHLEKRRPRWVASGALWVVSRAMRTVIRDPWANIKWVSVGGKWGPIY